MDDKHKRLYGLALDMLARHYLHGEPLAKGFLDQGTIYQLEEKNCRREGEESIFYLYSTEDEADESDDTQVFLKIGLSDLCS